MQENTIHIAEKILRKKRDPEVIQMIKLADKAIKNYYNHIPYAQ